GKDGFTSHPSSLIPHPSPPPRPVDGTARGLPRHRRRGGRGDAVPDVGDGAGVRRGTIDEVWRGGGDPGAASGLVSGAGGASGAGAGAVIVRPMVRSPGDRAREPARGASLVRGRGERDRGGLAVGRSVRAVLGGMRLYE